MAQKSRVRGFDLRQLEYFCALARTGSFTKAAEDLGIAQPSLSEQIARLEQGLGAPLFERLSRRIELTPLAKRFWAKRWHCSQTPPRCQTISSRQGKGCEVRCGWERFRPSCLTSWRHC